jgi:hypothetical protein
MKINKLKRAGVMLALSFLVSCGQTDNQCRSKEEMILRCQAEELSGLHFPTQWQINQAMIQCSRLYPIKKCY